MRACDWAVEKEDRLRILESTENTEGQRKGKRGRDKMELTGEEEEPEPHPGSHKYWGFLRTMIK